MSFTPRVKVGNTARGILTIAAVVLIAWVSHIARLTAPVVARHDAFQSFQTAPVIPAVELGQTSGYQPIAWYKSKSWWKRNAPIVGGAGGGALIGGLVGGGKGALIGGAVGGGGGYLYKRVKHNNHHYHHYHH